MTPEVAKVRAREITNKFFPIEHRPDAEGAIADLILQADREARTDQIEKDARIAESHAIASDSFSPLGIARQKTSGKIATAIRQQAKEGE